MRIGEFEISVLITDHFRLDGGAMFGSVPKAIWDRSIAADEKNRIPLACRLLVLRSPSRLILIDAGMGNKWTEKERAIYAIEPVNDLSKLTGVTDVILTHLHFDHAGGVTHRTPSGNIELTFPKARHFLSRTNLERAKAPSLRERASYLPDNFEPLNKVDLKLTADGDEVLPGIRVHISNGHTTGLQWITITDGKQTVAYPSDLVPTAHHIPLPFVMGYDMCAERTLSEKAQFLEQAAREGWIVVFEHDVQTPAARIAKTAEGRYQLDELIALPPYKLA